MLTLTPPRPTGTRARALLAAVAALTLVGCGSSADEPQADASQPAPASPTPSSSPSASPSAASIVPVDGTDLDACVDGACEVEVEASAGAAEEIEFDARVGIDTLYVHRIEDGEIGFIAIMTATDLAFTCPDDETLVCEGAFTGSRSPDGPKTANVTAGLGARITLNDFALEVLAVDDDRAVVRIGTA